MFTGENFKSNTYSLLFINHIYLHILEYFDIPDILNDIKIVYVYTY